MLVEPRPYQDEQDLEQMRSILIEGRRANCPSYYVHVGDLNWWLFYLDQDSDRRQKIHLWEEQTGRIMGWSLFSPRFRAFDVFAHPTVRNGEQALHMLTWTEERVSEIVSTLGGNKLSTMWIAEGDAEFIAHLERRGFARSDYHLLRMARQLDEAIPEPSITAQGWHIWRSSSLTVLTVGLASCTL